MLKLKLGSVGNVKFVVVVEELMFDNVLQSDTKGFGKSGTFAAYHLYACQSRQCNVKSSLRISSDFLFAQELHRCAYHMGDFY